MSVPPDAARPLATLSLDLDDAWCYLRTHGDPGWRARPSFLGVVVPRLLALLARHDLRITVFVVGADAAREANRPLLRAIAAAGHEVANHGLSHAPWVQRWPEARVEADVATAEEHIERATGVRPRGFRGAGFTWSPALLRVLARRGYAYDATVCPNLLGPIARRYYLGGRRLSRAARRRRGAMFGTLRDVLRPVRPYWWRLDDRSLLEIPVTTMPFVRLPVHGTYLVFLARRSRALALGWLRAALALCRLAGTSPSLLLHPLDLLGPEDAPDLAFFPGMDVPRAEKDVLLAEVVALLRERHRPVPLADYARAAPGLGLGAARA